MSFYFDRYKLLQEFEDVLSGYLEEIVKMDKQDPNDPYFLDYAKSRLNSKNFSPNRKEAIEEGLKNITDIRNYKKYNRLKYVYDTNVIGTVTSTNPIVTQSISKEAPRTQKNSFPIKTIGTRYDLDRMGQDPVVGMDLTQFKTVEELENALKNKGLTEDTIAGLYIRYTKPNKPTQNQHNSEQIQTKKTLTPPSTPGNSGETPVRTPSTSSGEGGGGGPTPKSKDWFTFGDDGENKFNPSNWGHGTQVLGAVLLAAGAYALYKKYKKSKEKGQSDREFLQKNPQAQRYIESNQ